MKINCSPTEKPLWADGLFLCYAGKHLSIGTLRRPRRFPEGVVRSVTNACADSKRVLRDGRSGDVGQRRLSRASPSGGGLMEVSGWSSERFGSYRGRPVGWRTGHRQRLSIGLEHRKSAADNHDTVLQHQWYCLWGRLLV